MLLLVFAVIESGTSSKKPMQCHCVQGTLTAAVKYRQSAAQLYQYSAVSVPHLVSEFVPWTTSSTVRAIIRKQVCAVYHSGT